MNWLRRLRIGTAVVAITVTFSLIVADPLYPQSVLLTNTRLRILLTFIGALLGLDAMLMKAPANWSLEVSNE